MIIQGTMAYQYRENIQDIWRLSRLRCSVTTVLTTLLKDIYNTTPLDMLIMEPNTQIKM